MIKRTKNTHHTSWKALMILALLGTYVYSQNSWIKTFGGEFWGDAWSVIETSDQAFLIAGSKHPYGNVSSDFWLIKTDLSGNVLWSKTYGGVLSERAFSVIETSDEAYLISGLKSNGTLNGTSVWLIKTDYSGDTLWTKTYSGASNEFGCSVIETSDKGYLIVGSKGAGSGYDNNIWLIKTDFNGDSLWAQTYGKGQPSDFALGFDEFAYSVIETSDQSYLIAGVKMFGSAIWIIKTDFKGDTLWTQTYGSIWYEKPWSVIETSDQAYLLAGSTDILERGMEDPFNIRLIKTDFNGDTLWTRTYFNDNTMQYSNSVIQTTDQTYLIAGTTGGYEQGNSYSTLIKTNTDGDTLWTQIYKRESDDYSKSVIESSDGGYLIVGESDNNIILIKTNSNGNVTIPVSIQTEKSQFKSYSLQIFPNPMNNRCSFTYILPERSHVSVNIFNISGSLVWSQDFGEQQSGMHKYFWTAQNQKGEDLSSGIYILKISTPTWAESRKLVLLK